MKTLMLLIGLVGVPAVLCADVQKIDKLWQEVYAEIYGGSFDSRILNKMEQLLAECRAALQQEPENYEYLWRYARAAGEYAQTAQSLEVEGWKDICREWGMSGFKAADRACAVNPKRPEAYFWRNYCMGMYVLIGGVDPIITAVLEGFLPKSQESVVKGYEVDKAYLDYSPVFARSQFMAHLPNIPFAVKGSKRSRYTEALAYYKEHRACTGQEQVFEWDIFATYSAEFLLEAVQVLELSRPEREFYLAEAQRLCKLGLQSPRPKYVRLCRAMLDEPENWQ